MTIPPHLDAAVDALIDDAITILTDRTRPAAGARQPLHGEHHQRRSELRQHHQAHAHALLDADIDNAGHITLTARTLANLLQPPPAPPPTPQRLYTAAEQRRRLTPHPDPLPPDTFARCLADARAALAPPDDDADDDLDDDDLDDDDGGEHPADSERDEPAALNSTDTGVDQNPT